MDTKGEGVFQEVDIIDVVRKIGKRNKATQAKILQKLEEVIPDKEDYQEVRKFILDELNNSTRAYVNIVFGDIEFLIK